jgi:hypothetical protein
VTDGGAGVGAVQKKKHDEEAFGAKGRSMQEQQIQHVKAVMERFKTSLEVRP